MNVNRIKEAKLKQREAELELGLKNNWDSEVLIRISEDIKQLKKELGISD